MCTMNWLAVFLKVIYHMFLSVHFRIPMPLLCSNFDIRPGAPSLIFFIQNLIMYVHFLHVSSLKMH